MLVLPSFIPLGAFLFSPVEKPTYTSPLDWIVAIGALFTSYLYHYTFYFTLTDYLNTVRYHLQRRINILLLSSGESPSLDHTHLQ